VESAFYTQVANALLVPAVMVCDPLPLLRAHVLSRCARTQASRGAQCSSRHCVKAERNVRSVL
jgi:hypothetical protein